MRLAADTPWDQIPGIGLVGGLIGLAVIVIAIRYILGKKN
jgi:hypothetical protein